ncbi:unnamed protein product [Ectocarpus sp. 12 AP-2014]
MSTFALVHGEVSGMVGRWREISMGWAPHVIALTGIASFVLTVMSLHATKFATPLTVSVLGALKQILVVAFSVLRMNRSVSRMNVIGLVLVLVGAVRYTIVSRSERRSREKRGATSAGPAGKHHPSDSSASVLPTTVPSIGPSDARVMVNGKRARAKRGDGDIRRGGGWAISRAIAWGSGWWGSEKGDASRRDR